MRDFGAQADWTSEDCITVSPGRYTDTPFTVESDWSAASYWYQMMAIEGIKNYKLKIEGIELLGLFAHSYQGDSRGAEVFARLGVHTEYTDRGVKLIRKGYSPPPVSTKTWWTSRTWRRPLSSPAA